MDGIHNKKRYNIGIIFNFSSDWMGGIVYIVNLIKTLDFLYDEDKPEITLFYRSDLKKFVDEINYPYFKSVEWAFPPVYKGYLLSWIFGKNIFVDEILRQYDLDGLYPLLDFPVKTETRTKLVSWYADLQHKYFPYFFTWRKIVERNTKIRFMLMNSQDLVVSSQAVANDFGKFFRFNNNLKIHIFHFVSVVDEQEGMEINELKTKYNLPPRYFMISNQFHRHKNHKILFKAIALMKEKGVYINFAFTGRFPYKTQLPHIKELHELIGGNQLQSQISFLGVIPRKEQLLLMKHAQAVIQPSLFEGWSTVIEDAKSLQVPVIASNIPVNIEQLGPDGTYFEPRDYKKLAEILSDFPTRDLNDIFYGDYNARIRIAAQVFISIFHD